MKYGLYYYKNSRNLGDDMWAYAQSLFYPHIDYLIDITSSYKFKSNASEEVASILGAFIAPYNYEYTFYPPSNVIPLFVGSYFRPTMFEYLDTGLVRTYLSEHAPIGCRTKELAELLKEKGIPAYFSGCITLTLPDLHKTKQDYICLVDVPDYVCDFVKEQVGDKFQLKYTSHIIEDIEKHAELPIEKRFDLVRAQLDLYAEAHCVVTSRMHVALPCLTQNTPVLLTITDKEKVGVNDIQRRIKDYFPLLHHNYHKDFMNRSVDYDFLNPPANPDLYLSYRRDMIDICEDFIRKCEMEEMHSRISSKDSADRHDALVDILQEKIVQLKTVVDRKNRDIKKLTDQNRTMKGNVLSLQARLRKYETFNEWENIEFFGDWEERSFVMSGYIKPDCKSLLDIGCGEMHIRKFLNDQIKYYGCDYKKRDEETIICDLAKGEFPTVHVDTIFIAGVLEYLVNWKDILRKCSQQCSQLILCYSTIEAAPTRNPIWVTSVSYQEIIDEMLLNKFNLVGKDRYKTSEIFNFVRS